MQKLVLSLVIICLASFATFAGNAGYVKGLGIVKGNDGLIYIRVQHSATNVDFGCWSNPSDKLWGEFYVLWNATSDALAAVDYSNLQKSLQNHQITIEVSSGHGTAAVTGSNQVSVVEKMFFVYP